MASNPPDILEGDELVMSNQGATAKSGPPDIVGGDEFFLMKDIRNQRMAEESVFGKIRELITGAARTTPRVESAQEVGSMFEMADLPIGQETSAALGLGSTFDPIAQLEIIKENFPEAEFESDNRGNTFIKYGGKEFLVNKPGISEADFDQALLNVLAFLPASKIAGLGKNLMQKVGLAFSGGAATSLGLDVTAEQAGAEDVVSPGRAVLAGGLEAAFPIGGAVAGGISRKLARQPYDLAETTARLAEEGQTAARQVGIDLTGPQTTMVPSFLEKQKFVAQLPAGSGRAMQFLENQNKQASDAVFNFMDSIAPPQAIERGAENFRQSAIDAIKQAKTTRKKEAGTVWDDAFNDDVSVDVEPVSAYIENQISRYPIGGKIHGELRRLKNLIEKQGGNIEKLHNVKTEIFERAASLGPDGLGPTTKRLMGETYDILRDQLEGASDLYRQANQQWKAASPGVEQLENSIIGKVAGMNDLQLKSVAQRIFDPAQTNPLVISNAKKAIDGVNPTAWNELMRVELERRIGSIKPSANADIQNVPAQLRNAIFGNAKQTKVLLEGMTPDQRKAAQFLNEALRRASAGRFAGSPTAARAEIAKELEGGFGRAVANFLTSPLKSISGIGREANVNRNARILAEAIFNPKYQVDLRKLRRIKNPDSPAAIKAFSQLMARIDTDLPQQEEVIIQTGGQ